MQTFLPYPDFEQSSRVLDRQRLGKQRVECLQILQNLAGIDTRWRNHPAVKMWAGHEHALVMYATAIINEWVGRGYEDNCLKRISDIYQNFPPLGTSSLEMPKWLGNNNFHLSHQSNLVRKDPERYGPLFPGVPDFLPYYWPTKEEG